MELHEAVEILYVEKACAEADIRMGQGNVRKEEFIEAVDTVILELEKPKGLLSKLNNFCRLMLIEIICLRKGI